MNVGKTTLKLCANIVFLTNIGRMRYNFIRSFNAWLDYGYSQKYVATCQPKLEI